MKKQFLLLTSLLFLVPACSKKQAKIPIKKLPALEYADYQETQNNVTVRYKKLNICENEYLFGDKAKKVTKKWTPLHLNVQNNSPYNVTISPQDIGLKQTSFKKVADKLNGTRHVRSGFFAFVGIAGAVATGFALPFWWMGESLKIVLPVLGIGTAATVVGPISSHRVSAKSKVSVEQTTQALEEQTLHDIEIVHPDEQINKLFFVNKKKLKEKFPVNVHILKDEQKELTFRIKPGKTAEKKYGLNMGVNVNFD